MKLSIIIPAHNEEGRISKAISKLTLFLESKKYDYSIIVVCNGCIDRTNEIAESYSKNNSRIRVLNLKKKLGKGRAIREGFKIARADIVGFIDADDSFDLEDINKMFILLMESNYDCVIASKWVNQKFSDVDEPILRKILGRGWNILTKLMFNLPYKDSQAGAKFLKGDVLEKMKKQRFLCDGFSYDIELLYFLKKNGFTTKEVFVSNSHVAGSSFSFRHIFEMFSEIIRLRIRR